MKKLLIVCAVVGAFGFMAESTFAIEYCKDVLEPGNSGGWETSAKTWDEEITLAVTEEVDIDIWLNDCPQDLLKAGFWIEYDSTLVSLVSVDIYDDYDLPGPWDSIDTIKIIPIPDSYWAWLGNNVSPDVDGDIILGRVRFRSEAEGDAIITIVVDRDPGFVSVISTGGHVYDSEIPLDVITIHQIIEPCCTSISPEPEKVFAGKVMQFTANKAGTCNPPNYVWSDNCVNANIDPVTGVFTIEPITTEEECSVCVIDNANPSSCVDSECDPPADCCAHFTITNDGDDDGIADDVDNCPKHPNGPDLGTCLYGGNIGLSCTHIVECGGTGGFCSMDQEDSFPPGGNGIGDACECEGDFDTDGDVDGTDASKFKADFGRSSFNDPCVW